MTKSFAELAGFLRRNALASPRLLESRYDVCVIGAGPAGALAAYKLAESGASVLLIDKAEFPRTKVCGCCLSTKALQVLSLSGLSELPDWLGGARLKSLVVGGSGACLHLPLPGARAISRAALDAAMSTLAIAAGAHFLPASTARVGESTSDRLLVEVSNRADRVELACAAVVVADGLAGTALQGRADLAPVVRSRSRIGASAICLAGCEFYLPGTIFMAYGEGGYAGVVRLEDGSCDVAAALDPALVKQFGGAAAAVSSLISACGWPVPDDLMTSLWRGTPALTRRRAAVAAHRLFVIGDAAGYLEPFTGEGMAWALASAQAAAPFVQAAVRKWDDSLIWKWQHTYRRIIRRNQSMTGVVTNLLRVPAAARLVSDALSVVPAVVPPLVNMISGPMCREDLEWLS